MKDIDLDFFLPRVRLLVDGDFTQKAAAIGCGISEGEFSKIINGEGRRLKVEHVYAWSRKMTMPTWFRAECVKLLRDLSNTESPLPTPTLDADGDGRVTVLDLRKTNSEKCLVSARRSVHQDIATADGVVSREEAAVDAQLAREERGLSEKGELISRHLSLAGAK